MATSKGVVMIFYRILYPLLKISRSLIIGLMVRFPLHCPAEIAVEGFGVFVQSIALLSVYLLLDNRNVMTTMDMINIPRKRRHIDLRFSPLYLSVHVQFDHPIHMLKLVSNCMRNKLIRIINLITSLY